MEKKLLMAFLCVFSLVVNAREEIRLTLVDKDMVWEYTPSTGDWYFGAYDESGKYTVHLDYVAGREGKFGTYTHEDLVREYSFIHYMSGTVSEYILFDEGSSFTIAKDGQHFTVNATLLGSDGNSYVIDGRFPLPEPKTIDVECQYITYMNYDEDESDWELRFKNSDYKITLDLLSPDGTFSGTYTEADASSPDACFITDLKEDEDITFATFTVTLQQSPEVDHPRKGCEITGTGVTEDGDTYRFHVIKYPPIHPKSVVAVDVELTRAEWPCQELGDGSCYELTEKNTPNEKWTLACYRLTGEQNEEEIDTTRTARYNTAKGTTLKLNNGKITQTLSSDARAIIVRAELVMSDSVQYNLTFLNPIAVNDSLSLSFSNLWVDTSLAANGSTSLSASNQDCEMFLQLMDTQLPGTYDDSNASMMLCFNDALGENTYINSLAFIRAESAIAEDGSPVLDCCFIGSDMNIYSITASFVLPEITDTMSILLTNAELYDSTDEMGEFSIFCSDDDYTIACYLTVSSGEKIAGHYTTHQLQNSSYLLFTDDAGCEHMLRFYSGEFDVTCDDDTITLTGQFQTGNYSLTLAITTGDTLPAGISELRTEDQKLLYSHRYNTLGQRVGTNYRGMFIMNGKKYISLPQ